MKTTTRSDIYEFIKNNSPISVSKIKDQFGLSNEMIHRHLKKLILDNKIYKTGSAPKVYYFPQIHSITAKIDYTKEQIKILDANFIDFAPDGVVTYSSDGFTKWCEKRNLNPQNEILTYIKTINKYSEYKKQGLIDGFQKMKNSFDDVYLDEVYYLDFYSIEKYGRTMLGNLMFYAKQTGDKELIERIINLIKPTILRLIVEKSIDGISFIPPSIKRKVQILHQIKKGLKINLPELVLIKIFKDKIVAQKSLNKLQDRIINAKDTIYLNDTNIRSNKILLIDDAVGSGSTLNETAKKIKQSGVAKYVIGLAIVGSFKGFDVINEI